ncbi:CHAD domain-containing protein [Rhodobacter sp. NTK016B]|uniref:CHAD domain-containing protein n=1 Tax=Rhodobacter sp. NTK016B TaxID=2759676 RepID=UPI001A8F5B2E|nr:CHAD domain-containing protein [Rhodobacter sp. NTK016B]MBN8292369.1 CHAD domain-containing protein [Rhodobacter sp. NTK016B]
MAYRFKRSDRDAARGVKRIARKRLDASLALIDAGNVDAAGLHELRKNAKKTRALLRLIRPRFGGYKRENRALRKAGQSVSALRDRDVMLALFDRLAAEATLPRAHAEALRDALARQLTPEGPSPDDALARHRALIAEIRARLPGWRFDARRFGLVAPGLARGVDEARAALDAWLETGREDAFHTARKRLKTHWYHATLLEPVWPRLIAPHRAVADDLGELFGDARDRMLLAERLADHPKAAPVVTLATQQARALTDRAAPLARRLLAEPGEALAARWGEWWTLWRY